MTAHLHRAGGQVLRHDHPDGHQPHGYYGHPEDRALPDLVRIALDRDCPGCGYPEIVAVGRLSAGADLHECNRRPPCGWRTDTVGRGATGDLLNALERHTPVDGGEIVEAWEPLPAAPGQVVPYKRAVEFAAGEWINGVAPPS